VKVYKCVCKSCGHSFWYLDRGEVIPIYIEPFTRPYCPKCRSADISMTPWRVRAEEE